MKTLKVRYRLEIARAILAGTRSLAPADFAEAIALQHSYLGSDNKRLVAQKLYDFVASLAKKTGIIPIGKAALSDDDRILVTEPYFEEEIADSPSCPV